MKKQTKGILAFAFLGGLMLTSGVLIAIPGFDEEVDYAAMNDPEVTITGTPADNFPDNQRTTFCSSGGDAKSTKYVTEYLIPTELLHLIMMVMLGLLKLILEIWQNLILLLKLLLNMIIPHGLMVAVQ